MFKKLKNIYYNLKNGVQNTIYWLPKIWKDEEFDFYSFHKLMQYKLIKMENFFNSDYAWGANSKNDARNIRYAINLLDRMIKNPYLEEALRPFYEKYPEKENERHEFVQCEDNPKLYRLVDKDTSEQKEFKQACYNTAEELEKKDYDEFYKFLREHIQEWWD